MEYVKVSCFEPSVVNSAIEEALKEGKGVHFEIFRTNYTTLYELLATIEIMERSAVEFSVEVMSYILHRDLMPILTIPKDKRSFLASSKILFEEPGAFFRGKASEMEVAAEEQRFMITQLHEFIAERLDVTVDEIDEWAKNGYMMQQPEMVAIELINDEE